MENEQTFSLWRDFLDDGGLVVISPYEKFNWGVSPRDVIALFLAVRPILLRNPKRGIDICSWEYFKENVLLPNSDWEHNLLVIGSEVANQMAAFMRRNGLSNVMNFSLKIRKNCLVDTLREERTNCLIPKFEGQGEPDVHSTEVDYALITRARNPFAQGKKIVILAGIKGYGTIAAALAFSEENYWREIDQKVNMVLGRLRLGEDKAQNALIEIIIRAETPRRDLALNIVPYTPRWPKNISVELVRVNRNRRKEWVPRRSLLNWVSQDAIPSSGKAVVAPVSSKPTPQPPQLPLPDTSPWKFFIGLVCSLTAMAIAVLILVFAAKQVPDQFAIIAGPAVIVLIVILGFVMTWIGVIDKETLTKLVGAITKPPGKQ